MLLPVSDRKVIPIAEATERRRQKRVSDSLSDLAESTEALAGEPEAHGYFTLLGNLAFLERVYADAIAAYSRALSLAPDDVHALKGRGRSYAALRELDLALADVDAALALAPGDALLHYYRGHCLSQLKTARWERGVDESETEQGQHARCAAAIGSLERALALGMSHPDVYWELVRASEGLGDRDASLAMLDRAVAALPDDALLLDIQKNWREHRERRLGDTGK